MKFMRRINTAQVTIPTPKHLASRLNLFRCSSKVTRIGFPDDVAACVFWVLLLGGTESAAVVLFVTCIPHRSSTFVSFWNRSSTDTVFTTFHDRTTQHQYAQLTSVLADRLCDLPIRAGTRSSLRSSKRRNAFRHVVQRLEHKQTPHAARTRRPTRPSIAEAVDGVQAVTLRPQQERIERNGAPPTPATAPPPSAQRNARRRRAREVEPPVISRPGGPAGAEERRRLGGHAAESPAARLNGRHAELEEVDAPLGVAEEPLGGLCSGNGRAASSASASASINISISSISSVSVSIISASASSAGRLRVQVPGRDGRCGLPVVVQGHRRVQADETRQLRDVQASNQDLPHAVLGDDGPEGPHVARRVAEPDGVVIVAAIIITKASRGSATSTTSVATTCITASAAITTTAATTATASGGRGRRRGRRRAKAQHAGGVDAPVCEQPPGRGPVEGQGPVRHNAPDVASKGPGHHSCCCCCSGCCGRGGRGGSGDGGGRAIGDGLRGGRDGGRGGRRRGSGGLGISRRWGRSPRR